MSVLDRVWARIRDATLRDPDSDAAGDAQAEAVRVRALATAPVVWLVGKTGAGKSSIVYTVTGDERARIGSFYAPCTRASLAFDFPAEAPVLRFLDTRGLSEAGYDPTEDLTFCRSQAHLIVAVMQAADPLQAEIIDVLRAARRESPDWPILVVQTTLHQLYAPGAGHVMPYPFAGDAADDARPDIPETVRRALAHQRGLLGTVPGRQPLAFVPIDFTPADDGFTPLDYGLGRLIEAMAAALPEAAAAVRRKLHRDWSDGVAEAAHPLILGYAAAAGVAGAIPIPFVDIGALAAPIGLLLRILARRYGVAWTSRSLAEFFGCLGGVVLVTQLIKYGARELLKVIPVVGSAVSGVSAFALTYAVGRAACVYLRHRRAGESAPAGEVSETFSRALRDGIEEARRRAGRRAGARDGGPEAGTADGA
jgi:uncharacterized protein (DUF697 family)